MIKDRNSLRSLTDEEAIAAYLEPMEEEEESCEFRIKCLMTAITARAINQFAKETGIDRGEICEMFISGKGNLKILDNLQAAFASPAKEKEKELVHA